MKTPKYLVAAVVIALAAVAAYVLARSPDPAHNSETSVFRFADMSEVDGASSRLVRSADAVAMEFATSGLEPGAPYTAWWVVFNTPEGCSEACNEDDIFNPDGTLNLNPEANISILFADGAMTDAEGDAGFSAVLPAGRPLGEVVTGPGLSDAGKAEVHVVVRAHGPLDPSRAYAQLSTFEPHPTLGGNCAECRDVQFAVHQPAGD